jgi:hypothetical protein
MVTTGVVFEVKSQTAYEMNCNYLLQVVKNGSRGGNTGSQDGNETKDLAAGGRQERYISRVEERKSEWKRGVLSCADWARGEGVSLLVSVEVWRKGVGIGNGLGLGMGAWDECCHAIEASLSLPLGRRPTAEWQGWRKIKCRPSSLLSYRLR